MRKHLPTIFLTLAVVGFTAQVLSSGAERSYPRWDEVQYLALARDYAREGGVVATIRCHLEGRCKEDVRHPLYQLLLQAVVDDAPRSFADAKLVTWGTALFLLCLMFLVVRRLLGPAVALVTTVLLSLSAVLVMMSASLVHDVLFTALVFAAVYAMFSWQERRFTWWVGVGALIGLAYLTKGIGHLLFFPLLAIGLHRHRANLLRKGIVYAAVLGFIAGAFFLLWRNFDLHGNPFHNTSIRAAWIDDWEDFWVLYRSPEWEKLGLGWYLQNHSILDLIWRLLKGLGMTLGLFVYSAGLGSTAYVPCALTGLVVIALACRGLVARFREGYRLEVLAVAYTAGIFFVGYSLGAQGGLVAPRYVFPIVALCLPFAAYALLTRVGPWLAARLSWTPPRMRALTTAAVALLLVGRLAWFADGFADNPRNHAGVTDAWRRMSTWFSQHLVPGESFAHPHHSYYSTWDLAFPDLDARWGYAYTTDATVMMRQLGEHRIRKLFVDTDDVDLPLYSQRFSRDKDAQGPLAFMGWPRCFADGDTPSRFLVYCRPAAR